MAEWTHRSRAESDARAFEKGRISVLASERELVQKKTFTKWVNAHLQRSSLHVDDLFVDLRDGIMLIRLLENISGEKLPKPSNGKMRIHKMENMGKALGFLKGKKVHLENVGAHDIVDGSARLTLGLIWTIILRFQIQDIIEESAEKRSAKEALLLWVQRMTKGYAGVDVKNFTTSFRDGLAFNALIHKHRPDLLEYSDLKPDEHKDNLNNAFDIAYTSLGLPKLLDAADVDVKLPDEKSIMTYVAVMYQYFSKMKEGDVGGRRINKLLGQMMEIEKLQNEYEQIITALLAWITEKTRLLADTNLPNSLTGIQEEVAAFTVYRTQDKPPKFSEKGNLEVLLYQLHMKLMVNHQRAYNPPDGKAVKDVNKAWGVLETTEHDREECLRKELIRQQKLEQLAARFNRKAELREVWLEDNERLVSVDEFGDDLPAVEAALKKHEAVCTDIKASEERVEAVGQLGEELAAGNYYDTENINERSGHIQQNYRELLDLASGQRQRLDVATGLYTAFYEMDNIFDWIDDVKPSVMVEEVAKHYTGAQEMVQKHKLLEADITGQSDRINSVLADAQKFAAMRSADTREGIFSPDQAVVKERQDELNEEYAALVGKAAERRAVLERSLELQLFLRNAEQQGSWIRDFVNVLMSSELGRDLTHALSLQEKHKATEAEVAGQRVRFNAVCQTGDELVAHKHHASELITSRLQQLRSSFDELESLVAQRKKRLAESVALQQYLSDLNETCSWLDDLEQILSSTDYGSDETSAQALLKNHQTAQEDLLAYRTIIGNHENQFNQLAVEDKTEAVATQRGNVNKRYQSLLELAKQRERFLREAIALFQFQQEASDLDGWINDKEAVVNAMTVTHDPGQVDVYNQRLKVFEQEVASNEPRLMTINHMAQRMHDQGHSQPQKIDETKTSLNERFENLKALAKKKRAQVDAALAVQDFCGDVDETMRWVAEKQHQLRQVESGKDMDSVQNARRRLHGTERDVAAITDKIQQLNTEGDRLANAHPDAGDVISEKQKALRDMWNDLTNALEQRRSKIGDSSNAQEFLQELIVFQDWLGAARLRAASEEVANNVTDAEALQKQHKDLMAEIDSYQPTFDKLKQHGKVIITDANDPAQKEAHDRLSTLDEDWDALRKAWDSRSSLLEQNHKHQTFRHDLERAEVLLKEEEAFLADQELGSTLNEAEAKLKRFNEVSSRLPPHDERVDALVADAKALKDEGHYAADEMTKLAKGVQGRRDVNRRRFTQRQQALKDSLALHQFHREADEAGDWISEKLQIAKDESYRQPENLPSKVTRHEAFEAELTTNKDRLDNVHKTGGSISASQPAANEQVADRLSDLDSKWQELMDESANKNRRLKEAVQGVQFRRGVDDLNNWLYTTETRLANDDVGDDIPSVKQLLKKHKLLEGDVAAHKAPVNDVQTDAGEMKTKGHFDAEDIGQLAQALETRYNSLAAPLKHRGNQLEESRKLQSFLRDIDEEDVWIQEHMPRAESTDYGSTLLEAQLFLRRQQVLQTEIDGHKPLIKAAQKVGEDLVTEGNFASERIQAQVASLTERWSQLLSAADLRQRQLDKSEFCHQYLLDAAEAQAWMSEQELFLMGDECGRDEDSAQALLNRHIVMAEAIKEFNKTIESLSKTARAMLDAEHFNSDTISMRQSQVDKLYTGLVDLSDERGRKITAALQMFQFTSEFEDLTIWLGERRAISSSKELGQNYDHNVRVRENFDQFCQQTRSTGQDRVVAFGKLCRGFIDIKHPQASKIANSLAALELQWVQIKELMEARTKALKDAGEILLYYRDADELSSRIKEKTTSLSGDLGRDLASVQALRRYHQVDQGQAAGFEKQVTQLSEEGLRLSETYPDKADDVAAKEGQVDSTWQVLRRKIAERSQRLEESESLYRFLVRLRDLLLWAADMRLQIGADEQPKDLVVAENLINQHKQRRAEISARSDNFQHAKELGREMVKRQHYARHQVENRLQLLEGQLDALDEDWEEHEKELDLFYNTHKFSRDAHGAESWLASNEAFLAIPDVGDSLDSAEAWLKKMEDFEKTMASQEQRFLGLNRATTFENHQAGTKKRLSLGQIRVKKDDAPAGRRQSFADIFSGIPLTEQAIEEEMEKERMAAEAAARAELAEEERRADVEERRAQQAAALDTLAEEEPSSPQVETSAGFPSTAETEQQPVEASPAAVSCPPASEPTSPGPASPGPTSPGPASPGPASLEPASPGPASPEPATPEPASPAPVDSEPVSAGPASPEPRSPTEPDAKFPMPTTPTKPATEASAETPSTAVSSPVTTSVENVPAETPSIVKDASAGASAVETLTGPAQKESTPAAAGAGAPESTAQVEAATPPTTTAATEPATQPAAQPAAATETEAQPTPSEPEPSAAELSTSEAAPAAAPPAASAAPSSTDRRRSSVAADIGSMLKSTLPRKCEMTATGKRATSRAWRSFFTVVRGAQLTFHKDLREAQQNHESAPAILLIGSTTVVAKDYTKKPNVLRVTTSSGGEYLFDCADAAELQEWVEAINQASLVDSELLAAAQPGPPSAAGEGGPGSPPVEEFKKENKRRSIFRKKK